MILKTRSFLVKVHFLMSRDARQQCWVTAMMAILAELTDRPNKANGAVCAVWLEFATPRRSSHNKTNFLSCGSFPPYAFTSLGLCANLMPQTGQEMGAGFFACVFVYGGVR